MASLIHINKVLSQLPPAVVQAWQPHFESVNLEPGQILCEPGRPLGHLYFPLTAIVSWIYVLENGSTTEVAMTGREGVVGIYLLMGDTHTNNRALVQKGGSAIRIKLHVVLDSMLAGHPVQALFLRYVRAFISHMTQVSVCHRHHTLEQQLSCMFLLTLDRQDDNDMAMTHEMLANLLGVRREGVTHTASRLMKEKIICYSRGNITVLNRAGLHDKSCECYGVIHNAYARFMAVQT